jgi:hypothetical protein
MSKSHQKKRNTGLLYEFLIHYISKQLAEQNTEKYTQAVRILKKSFKKNSELIKELKLIKALTNTNIKTQASAFEFINEAKSAARVIDPVRLDKEKSILIKHINHNLNEDNCFYDVDVDNYKLLATVQTLVNGWRNKSSDLIKQTSYVDHLVEHLTTQRVIAEDNSSDHETPGTVRLLLKVMTQKLNEKYDRSLTLEQKSLIKAYAFMSANDSKITIEKKLSDISEQIVSNIDGYLKKTENTSIINKLNETKQKILAEDIKSCDDHMVARFMMYLKLNDEISSAE